MNTENVNTQDAANGAVKSSPLLGKFTSLTVVMTYFLYLVIWEGLVVGGCAYVVFWRGESGWWFLLAVIFSGSTYSPKKWRKLFNA